MFYDDENQNRPQDTENDRSDDNKENNTAPETPAPKQDDASDKSNDTGYNYNGYNDNYNNGYNNYDNGQNGGKKRKNDNAYMSKKAVGWIVALCLVVSIICGVCANAVTGALKNGPGETTTGDIAGESTTTTDPAVTTGTTKIVTPISTDGAKDIPSVAVAVNGTAYTSYADVVEKCINSVVQIKFTVASYDIFGREGESAGAGSGVIFSTDGFIVTNYHVAGANTKSIKVILFDGTEYEAEYICGDESIDVSVIKINKNDCVAAKIGDSVSLRLGANVFAIGNPLGYGLTVSEGIISAKSRTVTIENTTMVLMQTTAAINSGNSGGGLFNMNGELVGITNAKVGGTSVESMGYAIPSDKIIKCINDFAKYGYVTGVARHGIRASDYITIGRYQYNGLVSVISVMNGSTAEKAGIMANDIIYSLNGTECSSLATLTEMLTKYKVGDTVSITVLRPTTDALSAVSYNAYLKACEEIELQVTFIEFNPVA